MFLSLLLSLFTIVNGVAVLNPDVYNFSYLTADDGMAQNTVDDIYKDSRGFMWFATWNGLNRFDGYEFIRYGTHSGPNSLNSPFVHTLVEDTYQCLWVGTEEGLNRIDLLSGKVLTLTDDSLSIDPHLSSSVNALLCDREGRIWVGTSMGVSIITLDEQGDIDEVDHLREGADAFVNAFCQDEDGTVWIGYRSGEIQSVSRLSEKAFQFVAAPQALLNQPRAEVFAIYANGADLWIGSANGLKCYNRKDGSLRVYTNHPADPYSLSQDYVKDIVKDNEGNILLATFKGLCIYNSETDNFLQISSDVGKQNHLNNNFVNALFAESDGTIWIGTEKGGINKMIRKQIMFECFQHDSKQPASLSPNPVNAIFEDSNKTLWVGTVEGGLNKYEPASKSFKHFHHVSGNRQTLTHNAVCFITEQKETLWVATWGGGLNRMDLKKEGLFVPVEDEVKSGRFSSYFISWMVYDDKLNGFWVATADGLDFYDLSKQCVLSVLNDPDGSCYLTAVSSLCLDEKRRLWVGTERGMYCIDLNQSDISSGQIAIRTCHLASEGKKRPKVVRITCVNETADQTIWLGTYGNGLYKLENEEGGEFQFVNYGTDNGLSDNVIYGICEDEHGVLWLSTNRGLSCFYPDKESAITFYTSDGLLNNQFYWTAACRLSDGKISFGNVSGLVMFQPEVLRADSAQLSVTLVGGSVYNEPIAPLAFSDEWRVKEEEKSFSLAFSALYYNSPHKLRYAYKLEGFDSDWTEVESNRRFANYTNLPAGRYLFKVRCTNPDGEWSDRITELPIRVVPPFYKESWFLLIVAGILLVSVYYINEMRIRNLRRQKVQLEHMVEERTSDLEDTLNKLMKHQEEISNQNERLIEQNNKISYQKRQLEELSGQLQQATQDKINFFTNITHEFKTPLTLILGPIEQALKLSQNPKVQEQLTLVRKNSKYLLSLINQLMDFRKADSGKLKVNKTPGNFQEFVQAIVLPFYSLAQTRSVIISEFYHLSSPSLFFDVDLMQKILVNLLSNAMKFTPDRGRIQLFVALLPASDSENKQLYISVRDTGAGIPEEMLDRVFQRFYQLENKDIYPVYGQSGTGIGLYLSLQIMKQLGGHIWAKNNQRGGASFRILLPLSVNEWKVAENHVLYDSPELYARSSDADENEDWVNHDKPVLLIVEDNSDMRAFIRSILEDTFNIIEASNGESGLSKTIKYLPDFIISDIMMPVMDGLEFTKKVKNNFTTSHIPVLLLTAKSSTDVRIEGYKSGADGYIAKPFDAELLVARINSMVSSRNRLHDAFENSLDVKSLNIEEESQDRIFLNKLMEVIQENYTEPDFDVTDLLEKMHISKSLLHKKLQSLVGQSAVKMIRSFRLNKAKELMANRSGGQMNISEIAYAVGFNDPKYFTRCFTKSFGISPSSFMDTLVDTDSPS